MLVFRSGVDAVRLELCAGRYRMGMSLVEDSAASLKRYTTIVSERLFPYA